METLLELDHMHLEKEGKVGRVILNHYLKACSVGTRMSKLLINQAFDRDYDAILDSYYKLQERAQYSMDAMIAGQAYLSGEDPEWQ